MSSYFVVLTPVLIGNNKFLPLGDVIIPAFDDNQNLNLRMRMIFRYKW